MCPSLSVLSAIALMTMIHSHIFYCLPTSTNSLQKQVISDDDSLDDSKIAFIERILQQSNNSNDEHDVTLLLNTTDVSNVQVPSNNSFPSDVVSAFNKTSKEVVELLLSNGNRTAEIFSSTRSPKSHDKSAKASAELNSNETRNRLLRILQKGVSAHEISQDEIRVISNNKFRATLEEILKHQYGDTQRRLDVFTSNDSSADLVETSMASFNRTSSNADAATLSSQLICQFFVFGTLFGVVCSISTCTCCLHPRNERRRNTELNGVNPTNVPAPIDYSKPYMLKCDSRGSCYASPLNDDEVPPLPSYSEALKCATQPIRKAHSFAKDPNAL